MSFPWTICVAFAAHFTAHKHAVWPVYTALWMIDSVSVLLMKSLVKQANRAVMDVTQWTINLIHICLEMSQELFL